MASGMRYMKMSLIYKIGECLVAKKGRTGLCPTEAEG
jgi:hypothetical protein